MLRVIIGGASVEEASLISSTMSKNYGDGVVEEEGYSLSEPSLKVDVRMALRDLEVVAVFLGKGYESLDSLLRGYTSSNLYCYSSTDELKGILNENFGMDFVIEESSTSTILEPIKDPELAIFEGWMASYQLSFKDIIAKFDGIRKTEGELSKANDRVSELENQLSTVEIAEDISEAITVTQEGVSQDYSGLEVQIQELTNEKERLVEELQNKVTDNNNLTYLNVVQKTRIEELENKEAELEELKIQIETQKEIFNGKLDNLKEEKDYYLNKYEELKNTKEANESIESSLAFKDSQIEELKIELGEANKAKDKVEEYKNDITFLENQLDSTKADMIFKDSEIETLKTDKEELQNKLNSIDFNEIEDLKTTIENLKNSNKTLSEDNSKLRRDNTELNRRLLTSGSDTKLEISSNLRKVLEGVSLDTKYYRIFSMPSYTDKLEFVFAGSHKSMSFMYKMVEGAIKASDENTLVVDLSSETYLDYYFSMGKVTNVDNYLDGTRLASNFKEMFVGSSTLKAMGTAWAWGGYNNFAMYEFDWASILNEYLSLGFKVVVIGGSLGDSFSRSLLASVSGVFNPIIYTESFSLALRSTMYNLGIVGGSITSKIVSGAPKSKISKTILASLERKGYSLEVIDD